MAYLITVNSPTFCFVLLIFKVSEQKPRKTSWLWRLTKYHQLNKIMFSDCALLLCSSQHYLFSPPRWSCLIHVPTHVLIQQTLPTTSERSSGMLERIHPSNLLHSMKLKHKWKWKRFICTRKCTALAEWWLWASMGIHCDSAEMH